MRKDWIRTPLYLTYLTEKERLVYPILLSLFIVIEKREGGGKRKSGISILELNLKTTSLSKKVGGKRGKKKKVISS